MVEARKGGAPVGNQHALRHGVRRDRSATGSRIRATPALKREFKRDLLATWPHLSRVELDLGIGISINLYRLREYTDARGIISAQGRILKAATEWDRQIGRWEAWVKRADEGEARWKATQDPLTLLMGSL